MMEKSEQNNSKIILSVAGICIIAVVFIIFTAFTYEPEEYSEASYKKTLEGAIEELDENAASLYDSYDEISQEYLKGTSDERNLAEYYEKRQYSGSPPFMLHPVVETFDEKIQCLACHAKGGWSEKLNRTTPITPHPEHTSCRQCHVRIEEKDLFVENIWESVPPPRLGESQLAGSPPEVPHTLLMRGNCIPCHVGPGAVTEIRVEHPSRGNCRQCHVPIVHPEPYKRGYRD